MSTSLPERTSAYLRLIRADRPIGTLLLLWPAAWALWIAAGGSPPGVLVLLFILGAFCARSGGCALNDAADADLDATVARTRARPVAAGVISRRAARLTGVVLLGVAALIAASLPFAAFALCCLAAILVVTYPQAKRIHPLPQLHLGIAFALGVPIAAAAVLASWPPVWAWVLACATVAWVVGYDTLYALADRDEDVAFGVHSTAILFGDHARTAVAVLYALFVAGAWAVGAQLHLGICWHTGLGVAATLLAWQMWTVRNGEPAACMVAFRSNGWVGFFLWAGLYLDGLL